MTVSELMTLLEEYRETHGDDCEVRLMTQQNWPFENRIAGLTSGAEMNEASEEDASEFFDDQDVRRRRDGLHRRRRPDLLRQQTGLGDLPRLLAAAGEKKFGKHLECFPNFACWDRNRMAHVCQRKTVFHSRKRRQRDDATQSPRDQTRRPNQRR